MVIFAFKQYKHLIKPFNTLTEKKIGRFTIGRFPNQELYVDVITNVKHHECLIIGSITPPEESLLYTLLLAHTLKKELASDITLLLPYMAYTRQDKIEKGRSLGITSIGELIRASHIKEVVIIDLHSSKDEQLFPLPLRSLSSAKIFANEIKRLNLRNFTLVAPDEGAISRVQNVANLLGKKEIVYLIKQRSNGIIHTKLSGKLSKNVILIDDILDTGKTLISCCQILKQKGVENITVMVTHGQFTGTDWQKLFDFGVKKIFVTDTIPLPDKAKIPAIKVLTIKPLIREYATSFKRKVKTKYPRIQIIRGSMDI